MNQSRLEWKVGLFVSICLLLLATLVVLFNKGFSLRSAYSLRLKAKNVGLLMPKAGVVMAGVRVGNVSSIELDPTGKTVTITLEILDKYRIHKDARFVIDQIGFLGDQFVSVIAGENAAPLLGPSDVVPVEEPFNLQEAARSANGLIQRVDKSVQRLTETFAKVDDLLLSESTLTNLTVTLANFRLVSDRTLVAVNGFNQIVQSNAVAVSFAVSNFVLFSSELQQVAVDLGEIVATNRADLNAAVRNARSATASADHLLADAQAGQGLVGLLFKDDEARHQFSLLVSSLTTLSSNLNKYGLLYKPKTVKKASDSLLLYPGKK